MEGCGSGNQEVLQGVWAGCCSREGRGALSQGGVLPGGGAA